MTKVSIAIRVYNRLADLECIVDVIKNTWKGNEYDIYIISNGENNGYKVSKKVEMSVYKIVRLCKNTGHQSGSSQLLLAFWDNLNFKKYDYSIIIEADTWMFGDKIICKYIKKMNETPSAVYAAAKWYDKYYSLATDFAIIRTSFLKDNRDLFRFNDKAECHMANYVKDSGKKFIYIRENMLPHPPTYIKSYPYTQKGRIVCFPLSKMVTHHIEMLNGGLDEKKRLFNVVSNSEFFKNINKPKRFEKLRIVFFFCLSKFFIRRTWFSPTVRMDE